MKLVIVALSPDIAHQLPYFFNRIHSLCLCLVFFFHFFITHIILAHLLFHLQQYGMGFTRRSHFADCFSFY